MYEAEFRVAFDDEEGITQLVGEAVSWDEEALFRVITLLDDHLADYNFTQRLAEYFRSLLAAEQGDPD